MLSDEAATLGDRMHHVSRAAPSEFAQSLCCHSPPVSHTSPLVSALTVSVPRIFQRSFLGTSWSLFEGLGHNHFRRLIFSIAAAFFLGLIFLWTLKRRQRKSCCIVARLLSTGNFNINHLALKGCFIGCSSVFGGCISWLCSKLASPRV